MNKKKLLEENNNLHKKKHARKMKKQRSSTVDITSTGDSEGAGASSDVEIVTSVLISANQAVTTANNGVDGDNVGSVNDDARDIS